MYTPDNNPYWDIESSGNDPELGYIDHDIIYDPVFQGFGAMHVNYSVHNSNHWWVCENFFMHPDIENGGVYDWSNYNTLSIIL